MIKVIAAGIWGALVALAATFSLISYKKMPAVVEKNAPAQIEQVKTKDINIPFFGKDEMIGYARVQFAFSFDTIQLTNLPIRPDVILVDEAYRSMAEYKFEDPRRPSRAELEKIVDSIRKSCNERIGSQFIQAVWIQDYAFIPIASVRNGAVK